jgi:hypothetical protein
MNVDSCVLSGTTRGQVQIKYICISGTFSIEK